MILGRGLRRKIAEGRGKVRKKRPKKLEKKTTDWLSKDQRTLRKEKGTDPGVGMKKDKKKKEEEKGHISHP